MSKENLRNSIEVAWFRKTKEPNGWDEWVRCMERNAKTRDDPEFMGQETIARHFDVSLRTASRWALEYRQTEVV